MALAMAAFVINDTMMKLVFADLDLFQSIFMRGLLLSLLTGILVLHRRQFRYRFSHHDARLMVQRVVGEIGAAVCFLTALYQMPIANAVAIIQAVPLVLTLAAALFLGEQVGWRRYSAIVVGFAGVLIIVRPGAEGFNAYAIWAVIAMLFMVLRDLSTRKFSQSVPTLFASFITALGTVIFTGAVVLTRDWQPMAAQHYGLLATSSGFLFIGYLCSIKAMRLGEVAFVSSFRYTILLWAIVLGILVFDEFPGFWTLIGAAIVVGMGGYTFYREHRLARRLAVTAKPTAE